VPVQDGGAALSARDKYLLGVGADIIPSSMNKSTYSLWIERSLLLVVVWGVYNTYNHLRVSGFLPQPYPYNATDTFMDWFHPAYYAHNGGAYTVYFSTYPPLTFLFLKIFSLGSCYASADAFAARSCDWLSPIYIIISFFGAIVVTFLTYRNVDKRTALVRSVAIGLGLPMLFGLERGNLFLLCYAFFVLAEGGIIRSSWTRAVCSAIAINFKVYLLANLGVHLIRRRWRFVEQICLVGLIIYLLTLIFFRDATPLRLLANQVQFSRFSDASATFQASYYSTTYNVLLHVVDAPAHSPYSMKSFVAPTVRDIMQWVIPLAIWLGELGVAVCFLIEARRPGTVPRHRLLALSIAGVMTIINSGGYSQVLLLFLVFFEEWEGWVKPVVLIIAYLLNVSIDFSIANIRWEEWMSWISHRAVGSELTITVGQFVRPGMILLIEYFLVSTTVTDFWRNSFRRSERAGPGDAVGAGASKRGRGISEVSRDRVTLGC
jgi:hypothetical protein